MTSATPGPSPLRSMTGFGRGQASAGALTVTVELRSVNLKGREVKLRLPRALAAVELELMKVIAAGVERGRVDGVIDVARPDAAAAGRVVDGARAAAVVEAARALATLHPELRAGLSVAELLAVPGVLARANDGDDGEASDDEAALAGAALTACRAATEALVRARAEEGCGLLTELSKRRATIAALSTQIGDRTMQATAQKEARLKERLAALLAEHLDPARLVAETSVLLERLDVSEELARLALHLTQLDALLAQAGAGRRLDFLCQELLREANTTASKCQDAETAHLVVELKAEIERLREQAQNVE